MANAGRTISAIGKYRKVDVHSAVLGASPHRLVQLLFDGALARLAEALGHIERGNMAGKRAAIDACIAIINGLRGGLNMEAGGELAVRLDQLYDYMARRLVSANRRSDPEALREVHRLLCEIRTGWDGIREAAESISMAASNG
ncbi:MAG: flagellar export chaperone FliS [Gammaproteobacteria bacterium]